MELAVFMVAGSLAVGFAMFMIMAKKPVTSALCLVMVMLQLAVLFAAQSAHLVAILQVLVYAGAIMVLFIFVIMLLNLREKEGSADQPKGYAQLFGGALGLTILAAAVTWTRQPGPPALQVNENFGTAEDVGQALFTSYVLPFEVVSILLLAALVGAVSLMKIRMR